MLKNHIYLQQFKTISDNISTTQFKSASEELRRFMDERGGLVDGFYTLPDPHVVGFKVFFHFHDEYGLLADGDKFESSEAYLRRIGETKRADTLAIFKDLLSQISSNYSHQMVSVEGIGESYNEGYGMLEREELPVLTINMFETLDNKVQALNNMYRNIAYDNKRKVWVLPSNLQEFNMSIYLFDAMFYTTNISFLPTFENQDLLKINHTMLEYNYCTFDQKSGGKYFDTIARGNPEVAATDITLNYKTCNISGLFRNITGDTPINSATLSMATDAIVQELTLKQVAGEQGTLPDPNLTRQANELETKSTQPESLSGRGFGT